MSDHEVANLVKKFAKGVEGGLEDGAEAVKGRMHASGTVVEDAAHAHLHADDEGTRILNGAHRRSEPTPPVHGGGEETPTTPAEAGPSTDPTPTVRGGDGAEPSVPDDDDAPAGTPIDYSRPSGYHVGVRDTVWNNARDAQGHVRDAQTGRYMSPNQPWDMGHQPGYEFARHRASSEQRGIPRKQFIEEHNDPGHYRPELPSSNRNHKSEAPPGDYYGP